MDGQRLRSRPRTRDVLDHWLRVASPFLVFAIAIAASLLRQSGVPKYRTIWAEDGRDFAACAYTQSLLDCLTQPYHAWIHLGPRVGAQLAVLTPPELLPLSLTVAAGLLTGLAAAIVTRSVRDASGAWIAGVVAGVSLVLTYPAGREVIGNVTNLPWMLLAAAIIVLVAWWIGNDLGIAEFGLIAAAGLSSPLVVILPAVSLVGLVLRRPRARAILIVILACVGVQAYAVATNPHAPPGTHPFDLIASLRAFLADVLVRGPFGPTPLRLGSFVIISVGVTTLLAVVQLVVRGVVRSRKLDIRDDDLRAILVNAGLGITAACVFLLTVAIQQASNPARYAYIAVTLICAAAAFGAALVGRGAASIDVTVGRLRRVLVMASRLALPVVAIVLAVGWARSFTLRTNASVGPDVVEEYAAAAPACQSGQEAIVLPISPAGRGWKIVIPCDRVVAR